jgi:ribosomal protein L11 methyltransferase
VTLPLKQGARIFTTWKRSWLKASKRFSIIYRSDVLAPLQAILFVMPWLQLKINTISEHVDALSDALNELGALSLTYEDAQDQPLFEPPPGETPIWAETIITGLFDASNDIDAITKQLVEVHPDKISATRSEILEDKDWVREWMERYKPMQFGERLWIVPSHHSPPDPQAVNILLDPGLAFGTGTHPTTAMCLEWLDAHPPHDQQVVDYGCGSGILAIAAAKLGASHVEAIDNDPQALLATKSNADHNQVTSRVNCKGIDSIPMTCDLLLANILAGPLIQLTTRFSAFTRPDANIVLSGILREQASDVLNAYQPWFDIALTKEKEDWVLLTGKRRPG